VKTDHLLARLRNDRFNLDESSDEADYVRRYTWNLAIDHAIGLISQGNVEAGLAELRDAPEPPPLPRHWLAEHEGKGR
jgi:hypothetical protein